MKTINTLLIVLLMGFISILNAQTVSFTADTTSGCAPLTVHFTNTSSYGVNTIYQWHFSDGQNYSGFNATHTFFNTNNQSVSLDAYDQSTGQHLGGFNMQIQVNGSSQSFYMSTGSQACPGENIIFSSNDQAYWVLFYFGDGDSSTWNWVPHTFQNPGVYNVMLVQSTSCGIDTIIQTLTVSNAAVYDVNINIIGGNYFCPGEVVMFSNQNPSISYLWDFGDGTFSSSSQPHHQFPNLGDYRVILRATNMCGNINADTTWIHISANLTVWAGISIWPNDVCPGQTVSYSSWSAGQYQWTFGDGTSSTVYNPSHEYADTGTYQVRLILSNTCGNSDTMFSSVHVGYHPTTPPMANINFTNFNSYENGYPVDTLIFCPNTLVEFRNDTWYASNNTIYLWDFGDGSTSTETNPSHTFVLPGMHIVKLIARDLCGTSDSAFKWIIVNPGIVPQSQFQAIPSSICTGENVYFMDNAYYYNNNQYLYSIWFGDGTSLLNFSENTDTLINTLASHEYINSGSYDYIMTATNNCGNSDSLTGTVIVNTSVNPNPFYYIDNSTSNNNTGNMPNWAVPSGLQDHQFNIPVHFNQWVPGMSDNFIIAFWYGHADLNNLGDPNGIMMMQGLGTANAFVPFLSDSVTILGAWFCGGQPGNSNPDAMGYLGVFPLTANGITNIPEPGLQISGWDGTCDSTQMQNQNAACPGNNVNFTAIGGVSYEWHFGDGATATNPSTSHAYAQVGSYDAFCIITNGCGVVNTLHTQVTVADYNIPQASFNVDYGGNGCVNTPMQYWFNNNGQNSNNYSFLWNFGDGTTSTATYPTHAYIAGGHYTVTLTVSNGCGSSTSTQDVSIRETQVAANVSNGCYNSDNGFIELSVNFGGDIAFNWSNGATTQNISNLSPGIYSVTLTEGNGCVTYKEYIIEQVTPIQITPIISDISCNGLTDGSIHLSMSGGSTPFYFYWSTGENTGNISGLSAGTYDVTAVDASGCSETFTNMAILEPDLLTITLTGVDLTCYAGQNGSVSSSVTGGTLPYYYDWSNGATTQGLTVLDAGTYSVTVTDSQGCNVNSNVTLSQPTSIIISLDALIHPTCLTNDGAISISVNGGTSGYSYQWSDADNQTVEDPIGLGAGLYTVTVLDANNCITNMSFPLDNNNAPIVTLNITNVSCNNGNNGKVEAVVNGGTPGYTYLWSTFPVIIADTIVNLTAGTYTLTVTDQSNCIATAIAVITQPDVLLISFNIQNVLCNGDATGSAEAVVTGGIQAYNYEWSNGNITAINQQLTANSYSLTITDNNGCILTDIAIINQPDVLSATLNILSNVLCFGDHQGAAYTETIGGSFPYSIQWSDLSSNDTITDLPAGSISVTVTDNNGCSLSQTGSITEPEALTTIIVIQNITCNGYLDGSASVSVVGGTGAYSYLWSNFDNSNITASLSGNSYFVTVTDENGCTVVDTAIVHEPSQMYLNITGYNVTCYGLANGIASVMASGGTGILYYSWSNGGSAPNIFSLAPDIYTLTVTDDNNCTVEDAITITEPAILSVVSVITDATTSTSTDGAVDLTVSGGTSPYDFNWSNSTTSEDISNLSTGNYWYVVSDANGCIVSDTILVDFTNSISVAKKDVIKIFPNPTSGLVSVSNAGSIKIEVFNLIGNKIVEIENNIGLSTFDLSPYADGNYFVRITKDDRSEVRKIILRK